MYNFKLCLHLYQIIKTKNKMEMTITTFNSLVEYLNEKKVPFLVKLDSNNNPVSLMGVKITKEGKFFRANGKIISRQFADLLI